MLSDVMAANEEDPSLPFTTCSLCKNSYSEPKLLRCMHTFCLKCLQELCSKDRQQDCLRCPLCNLATPVSATDLGTLQSNDFVERLITVINLTQQQESSQMYCSACCRVANSEAVKRTERAVVYCIECEDKLCKACKDAHRKIKVSAHHRLINLNEDFEKFNEALKDKPMTCSQHPGQLCSLYCQETDCVTPICLICAVLNHKSHAFTDIAGVAHKCREQLQVSAIDSLTTKLDNYRQRIQDAEQCISEADKQIKLVRDEIDRRASELHRLIDKGVQELQDVLSFFHFDQCVKMETFRKELQGNETQLKTFMEFCHQLIDKGSHVELCRLSGKLIAKAEALNDLEMISFPQPNRVNLASNSDAVGIFTKSSDLFGTISTETAVVTDSHQKSAEKTYGCSKKQEDCKVVGSESSSSSEIQRNQSEAGKKSQDSAVVEQSENDGLTAVSLQGSSSNTELQKAGEKSSAVNQFKSTPNLNRAPILTQTLRGECPVRGIAVLRDNLYVIYRKSSFIDVIDTQHFTLKDKLAVEEIDDPADLAVCSVNICVYICDSHLSLGFRVRLTDRKTLVSDKFKSPPRALSVTKYASILVTYSRACCIIEYTTDWKKVRQISTPDINPYHALQLADDQFVVCGFVCAEVKWAVLKLAASPEESGPNCNIYKPVCSAMFDGKQHNLKLKNLTHLAADSDQNIYIVDAHSHCVLVLNAKLDDVWRSFSDKQRILGIYKVCLGNLDDSMYTGIVNIVDGIAVRKFKI